MNKRYQVFVSSTFRDLQEERNAVLWGILELNHFPAGMEVFPAADSTPWDLIKSIIEESDYYVLIIGGCYGSTDEHGVSYTEREYDLAVELGKPIYSFLHKNPDDIPAGKSEIKSAARRKLGAFRKKVEEGRHRKHWTSKDDLRALVIVALTHAARTNPAIGWVRSNQIDNTGLLTRMNDLRDELDALRIENSTLKANANPTRALEGIEGEDHPAEVFVRLHGSKDFRHKYATTWGALSDFISDDLLVGSNPKLLAEVLRAELWKTINGTALGEALAKEPGISEPSILEIMPGTIRGLLIQLMALGLVEQIGTNGKHLWKLTALGLRRYLIKQARPISADTGVQP